MSYLTVVYISYIANIYSYRDILVSLIITIDIWLKYQSIYYWDRCFKSLGDQQKQKFVHPCGRAVFILQGVTALT